MYYQGFISICVTVAVVGPRRFLFPANAWLRNLKTSKITTRDVLYKLLRIVMFIGVNWLLYRRIGPLNERKQKSVVNFVEKWLECIKPKCKI